MNGQVEQLGTVSCPSGTLLILDGGSVWLWSHDRPPIIPELPGILGAAETARDLAIRGPDALVAGRALSRSGNPLFVFDVSETALPGLRSTFESLAAELGLGASIEILDERVPHRQRVNLSLASGNGMGVVDFHGMTAIGIGGLPSDRTLAIWGERTTGWRDLDHWQRVWIHVRDGEAVGRCKIGDVTVDQARVMTVDADALGLWDDTKSHDGKADVVFWGRDATALAYETGANVIANESGTGIYGWLNLPESEAYSRASDLNALRSNERRFTVDFRPHTHQCNIMRDMRDMRAMPNSSGSLDFGHARVCMFATSWGDGAFPVEADLDVEGRVSRIRIEFGFDETGDQETRLKSVNEGASE